jgi:predicted acyl esterase
VAGGNWCPSGAGAAEDLDLEVAADQRLDDARSLTFDSAPLVEPLEFLGSPSLVVEVAADKPVAYLAVRLNMVEPTGGSSRLTYGILNLCHRDSSEHPTALEPGRRYTVRVPLDAAAQRLPRGPRPRLPPPSSHWPTVVPSPEPANL